MNTTIKLLLLFLGFDILIYGIFSGNWIFIVLGLINSLFLLSFIGYKFDFISIFFNKIKNTNYSKIKDKTSFLNNYSIKKDFLEFLIVIRDINKHYIFISSLLIFLFILFSKLIGFKIIDLNIYISFVILIISTIIGYKDILSKEIYLGQKKLRFIDYITFLSIIIFYIFLNINGDLELYERLFVGSLFALIFFVFSINFLGLRDIRYGKFKITNYFVIIFILSSFYFAYSFFNIKNIYNDFYVGNSKTIVEKIQKWEKIFITPDNTEYSITKEDNIFILKGFKGQDYSFDSLEKTQEYILSFYKTDKYIEQQISDLNQEQKTLSGTMTDKELIPFLLKDMDYDYLYNTDLIFPNIDSSIDNYKYYNIAYSLGLIAINSDLSDSVYCLNYLAMKGLAEKWDISDYSQNTFFDKYYNKAIDLGLAPDECIENKNQLFKWEFIQ